ncbi:hypothetical protein OY1_40 [Vibrio phage OY1]|nr:hypothetical protein OY1_40 [Vibrio phage OY1]
MLYSGEGVLPHPRPRFPHGGCVCVRWRACARVCMHGRTCVRVCGRVRVRAIQRVRVCVCATRVLSLRLLAATWAALLCSMLAFFRRVVCLCSPLVSVWLSNGYPLDNVWRL